MSGAEDDYYLSRPTPYRAKNADFETVDELLLVKGMTPDILYGNIAGRQRLAELEDQQPWERDIKANERLGVAQHLSLQSGGRVNVNTASAEVLMAFGLTPAEVQSVLNQRAAMPFKSVGEFTGLIQSTSGGERQGFTIVPGDQPASANLQQVLASLNQVATVMSKHFSVESAGRMAGSNLTVRVAAILRNDGTPGRPKLSVRLWSLDPRQGGV
jgi:type II secretory pathway component PulK